MNRFHGGFKVVAVLVIVHLLFPQVAVAEGDAAGSGADDASRMETILAATFFGAGTALICTSAFVEDKYEKVTGYRDVGGTQVPIITRGGNDTDGLLIAGIACVFLGLCFIVSPVLGSSDGGGDAGQASDQAGLHVELTSVAGQDLAIGLWQGF